MLNSCLAASFGWWNASFIIFAAVKSAFMKSINSSADMSRSISISLSHSPSESPIQRDCTFRADAILAATRAFQAFS